MTQEIRDSVSRVRMSFEKTGENLIVDCRVEPGGGLPPHYHPRQEERWSVVEGRVGFRLGDNERVIGPVDGEIVVEPGSVHAVASVSEREAHLRCVVVPALHLQDLVEDVHFFSFCVNATNSSSFCLAAPLLITCVARSTPAFMLSARPET